MNNKYASILSRVKALVIDSIILILLMYSATEIFSLFDNIPNYIRIGVFLFLFLFYEPILVSIFGATVGHFFNDIVVKRESNENKNISFPFALSRFITKLFLGWISLLTVNGNEKRKAIHDYAGKSVVLPYQNQK